MARINTLDTFYLSSIIRGVNTEFDMGQVAAKSQLTNHFNIYLLSQSRYILESLFRNLIDPVSFEVDNLQVIKACESPPLNNLNHIVFNENLL